MDFNLRKNVKLEDRAFLSFHFHTTAGATVVRYLPFFQNPEIEESKKVNLVRYQPLGRSSTLATYTGAESRIYNVNFKITLPNIMEYQSNWKQAVFSTKILSKEEQIKQFRSLPATPNPYWANKGNANDFDIDFGDSQVDNGTPPPTTASAQAKEGDTNRQRTIDLIMYWINLVRSSALNNAKDTTYGPPIIRINQGILHQDVPCVCLDYKINIDDSAGYDLRTMMPRVVQFTLNLMEYRVGNFGEYDNSSSVSRDNVVGWEAIIGGSNTIDPIRMDIGKLMR